MAHTIFEILSGEYSDGTPIHTVADEISDAYSIVSHLTRLLNARQGVLKHLPQYGLPDITEIYQGLPYSLDGLIEEIKRVISEFEPRLKNVEVIPLAVQDMDAILRLEIRGEAETGKVMRFATYFLSGGNAKIQQMANQSR